MTDSIAGVPYWQLTFDTDAQTDAAVTATTAQEIHDRGITDLVVLSHGWNNSLATARSLYDAWFTTLAGQLGRATTSRPVTVGLAGVFWPSQRWSDEPIPDFAPAPAAPADGGGGAGLQERPTATVTSTIDAATLAALTAQFPAGAKDLAAMADLLTKPPTADAVAEFHRLMVGFSEAVSLGPDDEQPGAAAGPRMLGEDPVDLFARYRTQLVDSGATFEDDGGGGEAGLGDVLHGAWDGAKEALRQLTYYQMKGLAGQVGEKGLGPLLRTLTATSPDLRVHLVGHSFGARLVSYALVGIGDADPTPVTSVTLLQGAFSHFAFGEGMPYGTDGKGALAGRLARIEGSLTVCFSSHDDAVGRFYPLASMLSREDTAAADDATYRWGGMGHDGAQYVPVTAMDLQPVGATYPFEHGKVLNLDASAIVVNGGPPSGAHSDIVKPELTWVVLASAGIVG